MHVEKFGRGNIQIYPQTHTHVCVGEGHLRSDDLGKQEGKWDSGQIKRHVCKSLK